MDKPIGKGYSKGIAYDIYKLGIEDKTAYCIIEGWNNLVLCLFESIQLNEIPYCNKYKWQDCECTDKCRRGLRIT